MVFEWQLVLTGILNFYQFYQCCFFHIFICLTKYNKKLQFQQSLPCVWLCSGKYRGNNPGSKQKPDEVLLWDYHNSINNSSFLITKNTNRWLFQEAGPDPFKAFQIPQQQHHSCCPKRYLFPCHVSLSSCLPHSSLYECHT